MMAQIEDEKLYHEKQVRAMCALHALNNLFQKKHAFTKKDLDQICERLSPDTLINPHRSMLGLGNYDVNVLMAALQAKGYETVWFDKRKSVDLLRPGKIMGFILNTPSDYKLGPLRLALHCKHWVALRRLKGQYMNLDSKLAEPEPIGDEGDLRMFLRNELEDGKKELLLVVESAVYESNDWRSEEEQDDTDNRLGENQNNILDKEEKSSSGEKLTAEDHKVGGKGIEQGSLNDAGSTESKLPTEQESPSAHCDAQAVS